jgi:Protein of unknown function (DUF616)
MPADVAVITAIYGSYDIPKSTLPQEGIDAEWVLVTDNPGIPDGHLGWRVVYQPRPGVHPNRAAKHPKFRPWEYTEAPASVWIDGSCRVRSPWFASEAIGFADPIAQFTHPDRDCIYTETAEAQTVTKYAGEPLASQAGSYQDAGHPDHWGLWATTVIARKHTPPVKRLGDEWTAEVARWSFEDQISQPYVLRNLGLRPAILPGYYRDNAWLQVLASGRHQ